VNNDLKLSPEQLAVMQEHQQLIDALLEMLESADFKSAFEEMSLDEVLERYLTTLMDDSPDAWEHDLGERYNAIKRREAETGVTVAWENDLDGLEARYGS
jgi:hypothetical protein